MTEATAATLKGKRPPLVPVRDRLRWSLSAAAEMVDLAPNTIRDLERRGEFPPRVAVKGKEQFIAAEVSAWAAGQDWRKLVAARKEVRVAPTA